MRILETFKFITSHPLTRDKKLSTLYRFVRWQLGSRLLPANGVVVPFTGRARLLVKPGMTGATGNIYVGLHEFEDMAFLLHFLKPSDFFVDIGANIGSYSVLASKVAGADSLSIEPVPETFESLVDNIRLNGIEDRVTARNVGIGKEKGELIFTSDQDTMNHVLLSKEKYSGKSITVPVLPLTYLLKEKVPVLMKIDVEGFESEVIKGGEEIFAHPDLSAVIMELNRSGNRYGFDDESVHQKMESFGFSSFRYDPIQRNLIKLMGDYNSGGNTLYIRNPEITLDLLQNADRIQILGKWI